MEVLWMFRTLWPLEEARRVIETWHIDYNDVRPHSSLEDRTPSEFAAAHREAAA